ncbi:MAG TPA: hypothetical protein VF573_17400 [Paraburkholderia sp.]|uniref:hypothetical protein n=1 Tax=Paraburkholderia sp. TaxID=1926495 RepID=UPI002ED3AC14
MRNIAPVVSTLDILLRQSLNALVRENALDLDDDIRKRFNDVFEHIRRFYPVKDGVVCQSVVEPGAVVIDMGRHRPLRCPRLLVQCRLSDAPASRALTFAYVPNQSDRVVLDIVHADLNYQTSQFFQWTDSDGWCSADGRSLNADAHDSAIRGALYESDLFNAQSMALEPLHVDDGAVR